MSNLEEAFLKLINLILKKGTHNKSSEVALKCIYLFYNNTSDLTLKNAFDFYIKKSKTNEMDTQKLDAAISYVEEMIDNTKNIKMLNDRNLPIILFVANLAIEKGMPKQIFTLYTEGFFDLLKSNQIFDQLAISYIQLLNFGSMRCENVQKRIQILAENHGIEYIYK